MLSRYSDQGHQSQILSFIEGKSLFQYLDTLLKMYQSAIKSLPAMDDQETLRQFRSS